MKEQLIIATIEGKIEGLKAYLKIADPTAVETIKEAEIELKCLEKLLNKINEI
tara:strand:- start:352 stop:510 length:159 start_codon:yes stop_codon:yes gene_type:complete